MHYGCKTSIGIKMQFYLELLTLEMGISSQPLQDSYKSQKSLGESIYVWDNSGSLQYPTTAAKKKRQVDDDGIEAQRSFDGRYTPTQYSTGAPKGLILVRCFGSVRKILRQEISEAKRRGRAMVYLSVPK